MSKSYRDSFKGTAWYYARYRQGYPEPFFIHITERFHLDETGRLLDLGCGTGQLAIPLAKRFEQVIGMDPEPEMLAEAKVQARKAGVTTITWIEGGSADLEDMKAQPGTFRLVTMGSSFHWMDRDAILQTLAKLIVPSGGIVIVWTEFLWNKTNEWTQAVKTVIQRWLGEERRAGSSTYVEPKERHEIVLARSPFKRRETYRLDYQRYWTIESLIGQLYSTSFSSVAVLGNQRESFEEDLRKTLLELNPSGQFTEDVVLEAYLAWLE
jgi:ubiquinone/menaquinone biosynthesis C-methylase UbiE